MKLGMEGYDGGEYRGEIGGWNWGGVYDFIWLYICIKFFGKNKIIIRK